MTDLAERTSAVTFGSSQLAELIEHIGEGAVGRERNGEPPFAAIEAVKAAKLGALRLPAEIGGGGASLTELYEVFMELAAADSNVAHILRSHFGIVEVLLRNNLPAGKRALELIAQGELFGSASTEPSVKAGSTDFPYATKITNTPDGLRLDGAKHYVTGTLYMDWLLVSVTDVDGEKGRVLIPASRPGVQRPSDWDGFGQRFTGSGTATFDDVAIDADDYLPADANETLPYRATFFHIQLNAMIAGILRRVARDAVAHVRGKRRAFYHAVADIPAEDPITQYSVGLLSSQAFAAEALVLAAGAALERAYEAHCTPDEPELSLQASLLNAKAKVVIDELANRATSELFDVGGGSLLSQSSQLDRHWRNFRAIAAHNPKTLKAVAVGKYELNGTPLPNEGFF